MSFEYYIITIGNVIKKIRDGIKNIRFFIYLINIYTSTK